MRWDCLGAAGNTAIDTPNIDRLASRGVLFENAYSTSPLCVPARAQMLTGRTCWDTGVWGLGDSLAPLERTFAHALGERGYFTGAVGKMHFRANGETPSIRGPHGFDELILSEEVLPAELLVQDDYWRYLDRNGFGHLGTYAHGRRSPDHLGMGYRAQTSELPTEHFDTTWTGDETIAMIERNADRRFMICCSFVKPHFPCELPVDYPCPYDPGSIPFRESYDPSPDSDSEDFACFADIQRSTKDIGWLEEGLLREFAAYYYANITLIDAQVGRLVGTLRRLGLSDDTMVVFTSDHGEALGERGMIGKMSYYDESAKVPMVVYDPAADEPGRVDPRPVVLEDLCATFCDVAGCAPDEDMAGESMLPLLRDRNRPGRETVHGVMGGSYRFDENIAHCFVATDRWKYMYQFRGGREKLYDTANDPVALANVASGNREVCESLRESLAGWFTERGADFLTDGSTLRRDVTSPGEASERRANGSQ